MTSVAQLQKFLDQFNPDDVVYALQGLDDGIMVIAGHTSRFLHAAEADPDVKEAKDRLFAHKRAETARRADERRYHGD